MRSDQVTAAYLNTLITNGAKPGQCPAKNYAAHCEYLGENNSQAMMWFYPELPKADAIATCGANGGTYFDAEGVASGGPTKAPPGTPANPKFTAPAWRMVLTAGGVEATCTEVDYAFVNNPTLRTEYIKNAGFTEGECPAKAYMGLCHYPIIADVTPMAMKDYWLNTGVETASSAALKISCENGGGVWSTF